jgi:hypothetical protein
VGWLLPYCSRWFRHSLAAREVSTSGRRASPASSTGCLRLDCQHTEDLRPGAHSGERLQSQQPADTSRRAKWFALDQCGRRQEGLLANWVSKGRAASSASPLTDTVDGAKAIGSVNLMPRQAASALAAGRARSANGCGTASTLISEEPALSRDQIAR